MYIHQNPFFSLSAHTHTHSVQECQTSSQSIKQASKHAQQTSITCSITSGAIQQGVPTNVCLTESRVMSFPVASHALTPKSDDKSQKTEESLVASSFFKQSFAKSNFSTKQQSFVTFKSPQQSFVTAYISKTAL